MWKLAHRYNNNNNNIDYNFINSDHKKAYDMVQSWMIPPTLSQNVLVIRRSHKVYRENHGNLESGIDRRRKKFSWGKDPERYIPERCSITITLCNNDDATQTHTQEMHWKITRKDQSLNVYRRHQTVRQKWKRIGNTNIGSEDIGMEWKCAMLIIKSGNYQTRKKSEFSEKRKLTNTWEYWKLTTWNKGR